MALRQDGFDGSRCPCRLLVLGEPVQARSQGILQLKLIAGPFEQILITSADRFEPPLLDRLAGDDHLVDPVEPLQLSGDPRGPG